MHIDHVILTNVLNYISHRAKYASKLPKKNNLELNSLVFDGDGTSSWTRTKVQRSDQSQPMAINNDSSAWLQSMPKGQVHQVNGTLPANTQKYYILDRDDMNTLRA